MGFEQPDKPGKGQLEEKPEEKRNAKIYLFPSSRPEESESAQKARWAIEGRYDQAKKVWQKRIPNNSFERGEIRDFFQHFDDVVQEINKTDVSNENAQKIKDWLSRLTYPIEAIPDELRSARDIIAVQVLNNYVSGVKTDIAWLAQKTDSSSVKKRIKASHILEETLARTKRMEKARDKDNDRFVGIEEDESPYLGHIWTFLCHQEMSIDREDDPEELDRRVMERIAKAL